MFERLRIAASRLLMVIVVAAMALVGLTACVADPPVPSRSAMVGTWVHGNGSSRITLDESGKAMFVNVPRALLIGDTPNVSEAHKGPWADLLTVTGTWDAPRDAGDAYPALYGGIGNQGIKMSIDGRSEKNRKIVLFYGDDLEFEYTFHKVSN